MSLSQNDLNMAAAFGPALAGDDVQSFYGDCLDTGVTTEGGILTANAALLSPLINAKIDVVSDDVGDDLGSTGAEYVTLEGTDSDDAEISEVVELNGVGVMTSDATFKALNRAYISQTGASKVNEGTITISITSGADVASIRPAFMEAAIGSFTVPAGKVAVAYEVDLEMAVSGGEGEADVWALQVAKLDANGVRSSIGLASQRRSGGTITMPLARRVPVVAGESIALVAFFATAQRLRGEVRFVLFDA